MRRSSEANSAMQRSHVNQQARVAQLRERLDTIVHSLRICPPAHSYTVPSSPSVARRLSPPTSASPPMCVGSVVDTPSVAAGEGLHWGGLEVDGVKWTDGEAHVPVELYDQLQREVKRLRAQRLRCSSNSSASTLAAQGPNRHACLADKSEASSGSPAVCVRGSNHLDEQLSQAKAEDRFQGGSPCGLGSDVKSDLKGERTASRSSPRSLARSSPRLPVPWGR